MPYDGHAKLLYVKNTSFQYVICIQRWSSKVEIYERVSNLNQDLLMATERVFELFPDDAYLWVY